MKGVFCINNGWQRFIYITCFVSFTFGIPKPGHEEMVSSEYRARISIFIRIL